MVGQLAMAVAMATVVVVVRGAALALLSVQHLPQFALSTDTASVDLTGKGDRVVVRGSVGELTIGVVRKIVVA